MTLTHSIMDLVSYQMFLSQQVERNEIVANKIVKSELTDELPKDVRLTEISKLHAIKV